VFVPGRRLDAFDRYYAGRTKQRLVVPNRTFGAGEIPNGLQADRVYLLDGRGRHLAEMERAVNTLVERLNRANLRAGSLGELR